MLAGSYNPRFPINLRPPPRHSPPRDIFRQNSEASQQGRDRDLEQERCGEPQGRGDVPRVAGERDHDDDEDAIQCKTLFWLWFNFRTCSQKRY